ncbi:MAG: hypothetical protein EG824_09855 [Deltaproteobacteria bacterium]|nr:hypothetical protein [Deltaproteobacteria bacterium]
MEKVEKGQVAGLLSSFGPCGHIVRMVSSGELTLSFDARILSEYQEILGRFQLQKRTQVTGKRLFNMKANLLIFSSLPRPLHITVSHQDQVTCR